MELLKLYLVLSLLAVDVPWCYSNAGWPLSHAKKVCKVCKETWYHFDRYYVIWSVSFGTIMSL